MFTSDILGNGPKKKPRKPSPPKPPKPVSHSSTSSFEGSRSGYSAPSIRPTLSSGSKAPGRSAGSTAPSSNYQASSAVSSTNAKEKKVNPGHIIKRHKDPLLFKLPVERAKSEGTEPVSLNEDSLITQLLGDFLGVTGGGPGGGGKSALDGLIPQDPPDIKYKNFPRKTQPGFQPGNLKWLRYPIEGGTYEDVENDYGDTSVGIRSAPHSGVDFSQPTGTPVYAASSGIVGQDPVSGSWAGNSVLINHGKGYETRYAHLDSMAVNPGDSVRKGDIIGYVGSTGNSTGPHLHFETLQNGENLDPDQFLLGMQNGAPTFPEPGTIPAHNGRPGRINERNGVFDGTYPHTAPAAVAPAPEPRHLPRGQMEGAPSFIPEGMQTMNDIVQENYRRIVQQMKQEQQRDNPAPVGNGSPELQAFLQAISTQESGDNYGAVGVPTSSGRAYGKYQILDSNFVGEGGWDADVLGREITLDEYMSNPKVQEALAQGKLAEYFKLYGAEGAAKAWYGGPGVANVNSDSPQYGGPSINDYAASVISHMQKYLRR